MQLGAVYEESSTMTLFTSSDIWKNQYEDFRVFGCQSEDGTGFEKELDKSNDDYEGIAAQKPFNLSFW